MSFKKIAILGPGLLGGSLALAGRAKDYEVILWGRDAEKVRRATDLGFPAMVDLEDAVEGADLVVFSTPVGAMDHLAARIMPVLSASALVTDVGSVKSLPHEVARKRGLKFVGSHPMAGSEQTGLEAASEDLFENAACILTNDQGQSIEDVNRIEQFWTSLGCRVSQMDAATHDEAVARISHLPHAMAVATAAAALQNPALGSLAAGGFRDTTRVASGDPAMWAEILSENRGPVIEALAEAQKEISAMLEYLSKSDQKGLRDYLGEIKDRKESAEQDS